MSFDFGKGTTERDSGSVNGPEFIMPFERGRVTSLFHQGRYHPAIDLARANNPQGIEAEDPRIDRGGETVGAHDQAGRGVLSGNG